jgi:hypothetical protein
MKFFWVKLHIEFAFHHLDPYGSKVACPWIFYYRTYACNSFPGFFSTPFHIGTWNFPWVSSELSYTLSLGFIILTPMVPELHALRFFTIGQNMHVIVFRVFFSTPFHIGTWNCPWSSSELSYTLSLGFIILTPMVPELHALRFFTIGHMHVIVFRGFFSTPFHIGTWNFPWGSSELSYTPSSRFIIVTPMVPELCALRFFTIGLMHVTVFRSFFLHRFI